MRTTNKKRILVLIGLVSVAFLSGCTNWEGKYNNCEVLYNNCEGLRLGEKEERERLEKARLQDRQTIAQLQREIDERKRTPGEILGFGEGYDVSLDPSAGTITVTLPNTILFEVGKAELRKATSADLDHIYSVLQSRYADRQIDVVGHTDSDPIKATKKMWKDNWELSAQRALTVLRYLVKRGIREDRIREIGCGKSRPVVSNTTVSGKAKNRRVEIVVHMR